MPYSIDELAALEAAATPGKWSSYAHQKSPAHYVIHTLYVENGAIIAYDEYVNMLGSANFTFIAALRNALPAMLDDLRDLREMLKRLEWKGSTTGAPYCPECGESKKHGHAQWCALAKLIGGGE